MGGDYPQGTRLAEHSVFNGLLVMDLTDMREEWILGREGYAMNFWDRVGWKMYAFADSIESAIELLVVIGVIFIVYRLAQFLG